MSRTDRLRRGALLDEALNALDLAVQALVATRPDECDYTVAEHDAALVEHEARVQKLIAVRAEINAQANKLEAEAA